MIRRGGQQIIRVLNFHFCPQYAGRTQVANVVLRSLGLCARAQRMILTGSFGGQIGVDAILALGMIPPVRREVVETTANGAGLGAAMFLSEEGFALGEKLAAHAEQVDLDLDADFNMRYVMAMGF